MTRWLHLEPVWQSGYLDISLWLRAEPLLSQGPHVGQPLRGLLYPDVRRGSRDNSYLRLWLQPRLKYRPAPPHQMDQRIYFCYLN